MAEGVRLPPLREIIARYGLGARKSLGQHFLLDMNLTRRIARAAAPLEKGTVIEVGPGPGGLTRALLDEGAAHVLAVEIDERCIAALGELSDSYPERLSILGGDALSVRLAREVAARGLPGPLRIVANLPYNLATPLLLGWLAEIEHYDLLVLMFQREVAERLVADPGTKSYGRLSVMTQWLVHAELLFNVPAAAFTPRPEVVSAVVRLTPRPAPLAQAKRERLEAVTAAAFGQRRKMLRQSLRSLGVDTPRLLETAGVDPTSRAEVIDVAGFCSLARALDSLRD